VSVVVVNGSKEIEFFVTLITAAARDKLNLERKKLFEKSWVSKTLNINLNNFRFKKFSQSEYSQCSIKGNFPGLGKGF
jgi:hypothetical protein